MSDYTIELSGDAQDQISGIYRHIRDELCNLSAAESFLDDTEAAIDSLERFPYAHMVRSGSKPLDGYEKRQYFFRENYCLFYIIKEESETVRMIRVSYSRRDLDRDRFRQSEKVVEVLRTLHNPPRLFFDRQHLIRPQHHLRNTLESRNS